MRDKEDKTNAVRPMKNEEANERSLIGVNGFDTTLRGRHLGKFPVRGLPTLLTHPGCLSGNLWRGKVKGSKTAGRDVDSVAGLQGGVFDGGRAAEDGVDIDDAGGLVVAHK